ncbi:hypothetical protein CEXT_167551 [Caerostris extrusa]|uniref:Uncharacterized protein n=1 Tax=Caerostris extrusa TaxID=172846 RepID=A0AAV4Y731_CAEEX|nr:hypothetical protein CEXT_167551 [Caerostris extrusa]
MNEGDFPKFDSFDEAFMKRMVVCPFQSKFVNALETIQEPYTRDGATRDAQLERNYLYRNNLVEEWLNDSMTVTRDYNDMMTLHELVEKYLSTHTGFENVSKRNCCMHSELD